MHDDRRHLASVPEGCLRLLKYVLLGRDMWIHWADRKDVAYRVRQRIPIPHLIHRPHFDEKLYKYEELCLR